MMKDLRTLKSNILLYIKTLEIAIFIWSCYCSPPGAAHMRLQELDTTACKQQLQINIAISSVLIYNSLMSSYLGSNCIDMGQSIFCLDSSKTFLHPISQDIPYAYNNIPTLLRLLTAH